MTSESAYDLGWHQGSVFKQSLPTYGVVQGNGKVEKRSDVHDYWIVVTQDCNLSRAKINSNSPTIELRQVLDDKPPSNWGIHARKFLVDDERGHYLVDDKPSVFVSAKAMAGLVATKIYDLDDQRVLALKTWLGNRYDRPAVPEHLVEVAKAIAASVKESESAEIGRQVRDVYMSFDEMTTPPRYSLHAVVVDGAEKNEIRAWLAHAAVNVSADLGIPDEIEALYSEEVSFALIESSYCADLTQLTWADEAGPRGAY